ncbi:hypothetical protein HPB48_018032 [Haemaphysalis longicornis]|uniref:dolichyl-phosphate-mannose--protein mannosyltransferase n=1 Tax=Haemaphysalis longicornis TaxID=44386 RepID=A0A9J6FK87_HAELO|nr:hypothetical protein HPB48_018032 [Haemaphysalis longicornis]
MALTLDAFFVRFAQEQSHKSYRPLTVLTFRLNFAVHGLDPFGYHLVNVLLHALVCLLYHRMCLTLLPSWTSLLAALLFSAHPIHTEAVTSIVGRAELLSAAFFLGALLFYIRSGASTAVFKEQANGHWRRCIATFVLATAAMLCKEQGITVLAVCCIYELASYPFSSAENILFALRLTSMQRNVGEDAANDARRLPLCHRRRENGLFADDLRGLAVRRAAARATGSVKVYFEAAANHSFLLPACAERLRTQQPKSRPSFRAFCPSVVARIQINGPHLPAFNRFDNPASVAASPSRQLTYNYLAALNAWLLVFPFDLCCDWTMGTVPLVTSLVDLRNLGTIALYLFLVVVTRAALRSEERHRKPLLVGLSLVCIPYLPASNLIHPVGFVIAERVLYLPSLGFCLLVAQGFSLLWQQQRAEPDDIRGHLNLGRVLTTMRHYEKAEAAFLKLYQEAISLRSDFTDAYLNRGDFLLRMNRTKEAEAMYERALELDESNPDLYYNLGVILMDQGRNDEAMALFNRALELDPDHEHALLNSALLLQEAGTASQKKMANERLQKVVHSGKRDERAYFHLAMLALDKKDAVAAENWLRKAVLSPCSPIAREFVAQVVNFRMLL